MPDIILDAHFDVLLDVLYFREQGERKVLERRYLPSFRACGVNILVCSIFICERYLPEIALRNALDQISALGEELTDSGCHFALCRSVKEARAAISQGRIAIFLSLEGAEPIGRDIFLLRIFYELGVRLIGLTWSRRNYAGEGSCFTPVPEAVTSGGLSRFGLELLLKARRLGMVVDVSHLNDAGFCDVAEASEGIPFIASHSNCRSICGVGRNLTDGQIAAVAKSGGVVGMNAYAPFSAIAEEERTPVKLMEHISHIIDIAGYEHVGLGLDLCNCLESIRIGSYGPDEKDLFFDHASALDGIIKPIRERFSKKIADAILGGNFLRVFERILG